MDGWVTIEMERVKEGGERSVRRRRVVEAGAMEQGAGGLHVLVPGHPDQCEEEEGRGQ